MAKNVEAIDLKWTSNSLERISQKWMRKLDSTKMIMSATLPDLNTIVRVSRSILYVHLFHESKSTEGGFSVGFPSAGEQSYGTA